MVIHQTYNIIIIKKVNMHIKRKIIQLQQIGFKFLNRFGHVRNTKSQSWTLFYHVLDIFIYAFIGSCTLNIEKKNATVALPAQRYMYIPMFSFPL